MEPGRPRLHRLNVVRPAAGVAGVDAGLNDRRRGREGLLAVGDDPDQPWFAEGSHGTAEQRTDSFFRGYENSLDACGLG
ncbi:hypothetical protein [Micromonospora sp. NPDC007230]|uniref:hypothetical protein n=1 Tax=Micromonospora sp. NPDC007230 TaxID=3364237 RepID=UPI00369AE6E0